MRVLVTGGAGFIGSHLVDCLVRQGHDVLVIDDLSTGNIENLREAGKSPRLKIHFDRIENSPLLAACIKSVDFIFHLVPGSNEKIIKEDPALFVRKVMNKAQTVLDHAAPQKVPTLIGVSHSPDFLLADLGRGDRDARGSNGSLAFEVLGQAAADAIYEYTAAAYSMRRKQPIAVARLFNVAGPRQASGFSRVLRLYLEQIIHGDTITLTGDGGQIYEFTEVSEVVGELSAVLSSGIPAAGSVFQPARIQEVTVRAIVECAIALTGSPSRLQYRPVREGDVGGPHRENRGNQTMSPAALERLILATLSHLRRSTQTWDEFQAAS